MPQTDDLHIFGECVVRLGPERVKAQPGDETKPGIVDLERTPVGESKAKGDERLPIQFLGQRFRVHTAIIAVPRIAYQRRLGAG